jgi:4-hydroxy-2-oxoheptanedioate aldolase
MISRPLDIGAQGLVVPNVQSSEEARRIVQMAKYYPDGKRGAAFKRIHSDFSGISVDRVIGDSNDNLMLIVQIESLEAIEDIEGIVSVSGVDGILVGPNDLSVSLGIPGKSSDPKLKECVSKAIAACRKYNKVAGMVVGSVEAARQYVDEGTRLLIYSADIYMLSDKATESMNELAKLRSSVKK